MHPDDPKDNQDNEAAVDRWDLIRDIALLQVKLVVDGLRDFILVPVSLVVGFISVFRTGNSSGNEFYNLLRLGRKSERWINLFGAADRVPAPTGERDRFSDQDIDTLVHRVESFVVDEYKEGRMTRQARDRLNRFLDTLNQPGRRDR
jgi:hypothetical protein